MNQANINAPLLAVKSLSIAFGRGADATCAVKEVSFDLPPRAVTALVGESGCGKSLTALALAQLLPAAATITSGQIWLDGRDLRTLSPTQLRQVRGREIAYVFQDPCASLNPVFRVGNQLEEALRAHGQTDQPHAQIEQLLAQVGLPATASRAYPHQLSGGMQQRVMIAMALACRPRILVADEPTTALDVTVQKQILALLLELKERAGLAILLISHNLGIVAEVADQMYVMYAGRIIEAGPARQLLAHPAHPYTCNLKRAVPRLAQADMELQGIPGRVPQPGAWPEGCKFHPRCTDCQDRCRREEPALRNTRGPSAVRCFYPREQAP